MSNKKQGSSSIEAKMGREINAWAIPKKSKWERCGPSNQQSMA